MQAVCLCIETTWNKMINNSRGFHCTFTCEQVNLHCRKPNRGLTKQQWCPGLTHPSVKLSEVSKIKEHLEPREDRTIQINPCPSLPGPWRTTGNSRLFCPFTRAYSNQNASKKRNPSCGEAWMLVANETKAVRRKKNGAGQTWKHHQ